MTMRERATTNLRLMPRHRGPRAFIPGFAGFAAMILAFGCGSDGGGNNVTCGKGTVLKGSTCILKAPVTEADASAGGESGDGGRGGGGTGGTAGSTTAGSGGMAGVHGDAGPGDSGAAKDEIQFAGITSASPGEPTPIVGKGEKPPPPDSIRLTWSLASYAAHPLATLRYQIFASTSPGKENFKDPIAESPPGSTSFLVQGLEAKTAYSFVVRAVASEGAARDSNTVELTATPDYDDEPPKFAGAVKPTDATATTVTLSWKAASDDLTPAEGLTYRIYWGTKTGNATTLGAVSAPGETSATVTGLPAADTEFFFKVVAVDAAGNQSTNTDDFSAKTGPDDTAPVFGGCTSATDPTAGGATVTWIPAVDDTTPAAQIQYEVFAFEVPVTRDTPFDKIKPVSTFTGGVQGEVKGLKPGASYRVVCRAVDGSGNSDDNRVTQVFTTKLDGKAPTFDGPKTGDKDSTIGSTQIDLNWLQAKDDQSPDNRIIYYVYVTTDAGKEDFDSPPLVKTDPGVLGASVLGLLSNTQYYFVVRAVDEAGNVDDNTAELPLKTLVSFANDVQPIFTANCALASCHVPGNPPQGQILQEGYAFASIVGQTAREGAQIGEPELKRIDPTNPDPDKSYLWRKISGTGVIASGSSTMPPASANRVLTDEQKTTIKTWIQQGAKDN